MTEQELKEKIVKILEEYRDWFIEEDYKRDIANIDYTGIADALIAAGIGDVSEYKHRAEVAEKALKDEIKLQLKLTNYSEDAIFVLYPMALKQAEKELQEERKDE